jgi:UDP-N-acetylglucosamine 4,6-dehydratase/5-epimerase
MFDVLHGKRVLITGATGSFGQHFVTRLAKIEEIQELRLFSRDEERQRLLRLMLERQDRNGGPRCRRVQFVIGDVRDASALRTAAHGVDVLLNAAAMKQVPSCELNVIEAVKTNVLGMQNLIDVAVRQGCERVLTISTDKAVKPINAMGMTKALQEKLVSCAGTAWGGRPIFTTVRYGNVIGTTGSVFRVFCDQISRGAPLTLTRPDMTRFLLTLDETTGLVERALTEEESGTVIVRSAKAATVGDVALACLRVLGEPDDYPMEQLGSRSGDKFHEVLVSEDERRRTYREGDFLLIRREETGPVDRTIDWDEFSSANAERFSFEELREIVARWYEEWSNVSSDPYAARERAEVVAP